MDKYQHLGVVSNLHLGGPPGRQIFRSGELLAKGIAELGERDGSVGLVLNGDVVDFLAEEDARPFDPEGAVSRLERIIDDPSFQAVFESLAQFCQKRNRTLGVVLGNHDAEMAFPEVQEVLLARLSNPGLSGWRKASIADEVRGRVRFATRGYGYSCRVGGKTVYCFHGDIADGWNAVNHSGLARNLHDQLRGVTARVPAVPPGTTLVVNHLNAVKAELPFADLLKPEIDIAAFLVGMLRPAFAKQLPWMLALKAKAKVRAAAGTEYLYQAADLSGQPGRGSLPSADELESELSGLRNVSPLQLLDESEYLTLGLMPNFHELARRHVAARINKDWALGAPDEPYGWIERNQVKADLVVAGHTHLRRIMPRPLGGWYVNSGTWIDLIRLEPSHVATEKAFADLCLALDTPKIAELPAGMVRSRPTWVFVEPDSTGTCVRLKDPSGIANLAQDEALPSGGQRL